MMMLPSPFPLGCAERAPSLSRWEREGGAKRRKGEGDRQLHRCREAPEYQLAPFLQSNVLLMFRFMKLAHLPATRRVLPLARARGNGVTFVAFRHLSRQIERLYRPRVHPREWRDLRDLSVPRRLVGFARAREDGVTFVTFRHLNRPARRLRRPRAHPNEDA